MNEWGAGDVARIQAALGSPPTAPQDLSAAPGDTQVVLSWSAPADNYNSDIVRYEVRHVAGASVPEETAWTSVGLVTTHTVTGLDNGTQRSFEVRAVNGVGGGAAAQTQATPIGVPTAPQEFAIAKSAGHADLSWSPPANDGGSDILRYEYRSIEGSAVPADTEWVSIGLITSGRLDSLRAGTLYTFELRAVNGQGPGAVARLQATAGIPPTAPQDLAAAPGDAQVVLRWSAPADNYNSDIVRYEVRHVAGASVPEETVWTSVGLVTTHTVTGLDNGTQRSFEVRAVNGVGGGAAAQTQATPGRLPSAPQEFTIEKTARHLDFSWSAPADDGGSDILRYEVRSVQGSAVPADTEWTQVGLSTSNRFITGNTGTLYTFEVRAVNGRGPGAVARIQATPGQLPSAPQELTAEISAGRVDLSWSAPSYRGGSDILRYEMRHAQGAAVPADTEWVSIGSGTASALTGLSNSEPYTFEVRAVNGEGAGDVARTQATPGSAPTAPQDLAAAPDDTQVVLSWSAPTDNYNSDIVRYEVRHVAGTSVPEETAWTSVGLVTTHTVTGLTMGTRHTFEVRAVNGRGGGAAAQIQATPSGVPTAPQEFRIAKSAEHVDLSWSPPASDGGSDILRYEYRSIEGSAVPADAEWVSIGLITSGRLYSLSNGELHTFELRAVNERGPGAVARLQATPGIPTVSVEAIQSTVTEGSDVQFRFRRNGNEHLALRFFVDIAGHLKTMSPTTRTLSFSSEVGGDLAVTFEPGQTETTVSLTTEADRVNEGDGEILVTINPLPAFDIAGGGKATVLVEDDDIPEVTLRWVSPAMTLQNNVWVGSMVEGEDLQYEVVCSGNTLVPADLEGNTGADAITQQRIVVRKQENLNHPTFPQYNKDQEFRAPCADSPSMYRLHFGSITNRFTGPENGEIRIDLLPQQLVTSALYRCYQDSVRHSAQAEDVRFCPKYTLGAVTTARIEVLNRNPTVTVEAVDDEVTEGDPARFRLTRIWTSDWLNSERLLAASTMVDYTSAAVGNYVTSPPSGQKIFAASETEIIVEIPTVRDGVAGEDGQVTFELLPGTAPTQSANIGGHYEVYDRLPGITPPGKSSRVATVRILSDEGQPGVAVSATALRVPEGDSRTYTVALRSQPAGPVTVTPSVKAGSSSDVTVSGALTFTAATWNRAQTVTVSTAQDADAANDAATVSHTVSGGGYGSETVPDVAVTVEDDDELGVEVSASALTVPEGASRTYTVVLSSQPTGPVTVSPSVAGSPDVTVSGALTFTAQTWNRAQTVTVSAAQDADATDEVATVSHAVSGGDYGSATVPEVAVVVVDDETPSTAVALTVSPGTVDEDAGATAIAVTGTLNEAARRYDTAVTVSVSAGTSSAGDFAAVVDFTLTIPAGQTSGTATFTLTPVDDAIYEDDETVNVTGTTLVLAVTGAAVTVSDDDTRGVAVSATALRVPEGDSRTYTVALRSQPAGPVTVTPSAAGSADVTVSPSVLSFTAQNWATAQTVTVSAAQDADAANDAATVSHAVSGSDYGSVTAPDTAVTVEDDDELGVEVSASALTVPEGASRTYTVVLTSEPSGDVTVTPSVKAGSSPDVTVSGALTFTAETWDRAQTVTVSAAHDADAADDAATVSHTVSGGGYGSATASDVTVTVEDDDELGVEVSASAMTVPEGASRTYTVVLTSEPSGDVTVTPSVKAGSSPDVTVSGALTFTAETWNRAQTVTVSAAQDADATDEVATVSHAVSGGDYGSVTVPEVAVVVVDDETPSTAVALTVSPGTVDEDAGATAIAVTGTLNEAARRYDTAVTVSVSAGTSSAGDFAAVVDFTLTIPAGQTSGTATFTLTPVDDAIYEDDETVNVTGTALVLAVTGAAVTVSDDDTRGVAVSATALRVPEGDSRTYTVALRSQPAGPVTVTPSAAGSADVTVSPSVLSFTAQNWATAQTVTVSAAQDADAANDAATVSHAVSGGGYGSATASDVTVTVEDDDELGVEVSASALTVPEGASRTYTVVLTSEPSGDVTVTPSVKAGSSPDVTVSGALTFTAETWDRAQTVTVSAAHDADAADDAATVSHTVSGGGYGSATASDVTVTVEDDDELGVEVSASALTVPEGASRTYTVVLSSQPTGPVTVSPSVAGSPDVTVSGALTFTAETWDRAQTVTVSAAQDDDAADDAATVSHTVSGGGFDSVTAADVAVTVEDDDERGVSVSTTAMTVPEGASRTYTVVLSSQPTGPVTVSPSVAGSPDVTVSGALTFTAQTWDRAQTVTVSAAQDADAANDAATVSHTVSGGGFDSVTAADVAVTVSDDETASAGVALTVSPGTVDEDAGATTVTVTGTLDGAPRTSETALTVSVSAGTASAADFAAVADFTLTIAAGQSSGTATFTLTPVDDAIEEGDGTVNVTGTAQGLKVTGAAVKIVDDDGRGIEVSASLTVPEGASRTYTVVLSSQPTGPVTVSGRRLSAAIRG